MVTKGLLSLLPLLAVGATAAPHERREVETDFIVYAYGKGITGFPVYADANGSSPLNEEAKRSSSREDG